MRKNILLPFFASLFLLVSCNTQTSKANETEATSEIQLPVQSGLVIPADTFGIGKDALYITLVGHGSLMMEYKGQIIHIDPYSAVADYSKLPKADLILLTHQHSDHLDRDAIAAVRKDSTHFIMSQSCNDELKYGEVLKNGASTSCIVPIAAHPAYNIVNKWPSGDYYHPQGVGNGYLMQFGELKVYVAGDTENIPELSQLGNVDVAFLPKNTPYTMTDEMFVDAAKKISPKYLYPYHFAEFDKAKIEQALDGTGIELKIRSMKNK